MSVHFLSFFIQSSSSRSFKAFSFDPAGSILVADLQHCFDGLFHGQKRPRFEWLCYDSATPLSAHWHRYRLARVLGPPSLVLQPWWNGPDVCWVYVLSISVFFLSHLPFVSVLFFPDCFNPHPLCPWYPQNLIWHDFCCKYFCPLLRQFTLYLAIMAIFWLCVFDSCEIILSSFNLWHCSYSTSCHVNVWVVLTSYFTIITKTFFLHLLNLCCNLQFLLSCWLFLHSCLSLHWFYFLNSFYINPLNPDFPSLRMLQNYPYSIYRLRYAHH